MRICSLLPSATEILYALGLGDAVVGVTHECDYPPEAGKKPPLIRPRGSEYGQRIERRFLHVRQALNRQVLDCR